MGDYHAGELEIQARAGVLTEGARIGKSIRATIPAAAQVFLREQPMIIAATVDVEGRVWVSLLTGKPGFLEALDEQTVEIRAAPHPSDALSANLRVGGTIGLIAIDFATRRRMRVNGWVKSVRQGNIVVQAGEVYGNCHKYIQARALLIEDMEEHSADCIENAEAVQGGGPVQVNGAKEISSEQRAWIERADTFFIASSHRDDGADASHRGGPPGFVRVENARRLVFPDYSGNKMFQTLGNISADPHAGLLFIDFESGDTLQLTG